MPSEDLKWRAVNAGVDGLVLPPGLRAVTFDRMFKRPVESAMMPASLEMVSLGLTFDQLIEGIALPAQL